MTFWTILLALTAGFLSITCAAPLNSNAPVSHFSPPTVGQNAITPSVFDALRELYIAQPINDISPRTVADDSIVPVHNVTFHAVVGNITADLSKKMTSPAAIPNIGTEPAGSTPSRSSSASTTATSPGTCTKALSACPSTRAVTVASA
jgi:hypothetical protein